VDPATGDLVQGIEGQTERALTNLVAVLAAAGLTTANVVKVTVFMADLANFAAMNAIYAKYFDAPEPARSTVQVAALPKGAMVEIEAIVKKAS
jgi:2-iminobutanoate/2-iminopropanoate deaminase